MTGIPRDLDLIYERAILAYEEEKYDTASLILDQALQGNDAPHIKLLEARSLTREKLGDCKGAYEDAKSMLRMYPTQLSSYSRTGTILESMKKWKMAVAIYKQGISILVGDNEVQFLRDMLQKVSRQSMILKCSDPCQRLPAEIMLQVLRVLAFEQLIPLQRVSRAWKNFIVSAAELWEHLDFSKAEGPVSLHAFTSSIENARGHCSRLTLNGCALPHDDNLRYLWQNCNSTLLSGLTSVEVGNVPVFTPYYTELHQLTSLILWGRVGFGDVRMLLNELHNLRKLELYDVRKDFGETAMTRKTVQPSKIEILLLRAKITQPLLGIARPSDWHYVFPKCKKLSLIGAWYKDGLPRILTKGMKSLYSLHLASPWSYECTLELSSNLKSLKLESLCSHLKYESYQKTFLRYLTELTSLELSNCDLKDEILREIVSCCAKKLHHIDLHNDDRLTSAGLQWVFTNCPQLRTVVVCEIPAVDDATMSALSDLNHLEHVDLENCTSITNYGFVNLIKKRHERLRHVDISNLDDVTDGSVEYARSLGIEVEYNFHYPRRNKRRKTMEFPNKL